MTEKIYSDSNQVTVIAERSGSLKTQESYHLGRHKPIIDADSLKDFLTEKRHCQNERFSFVCFRKKQAEIDNLNNTWCHLFKQLKQFSQEAWNYERGDLRFNPCESKIICQLEFSIAQAHSSRTPSKKQTVHVNKFVFETYLLITSYSFSCHVPSRKQPQLPFFCSSQQYFSFYYPTHSLFFYPFTQALKQITHVSLSQSCFQYIL